MTETTTTETQPQAELTATEVQEPTPNGATPPEVVAEPEPEAEPTVNPLDTFRAALEKGDLDLYVVEEEPAVKKHLERRDRQMREEIQAKADAEVREKTQRWETTQTADKLAGYVGGLLEKLEAADLPGAERLMARLETFSADNIKNLIEFARNEGRDQGATQEKTSLANALTHGFDRRMKDEFQDSLRPGMTFEDGVALHDKIIAAKHKSELAAKDDVIGRLKAENREGKGPNLAQSASGTGGINTYEEASRRYNLPIGHPDKLSHDAFKEQRLRFGIK